MNQLETIPGVLRRAAEHYREHAALEAGARRLSYGELLSEAQLTAASLLAAGIEPQDRVAIWAPNSCDWVVLALGVALAGASLVPINTRFKAAEAGYLLEKSRARLLFTVREFLGAAYFEPLRAEHGGQGRERPIAGLPSLESVVLLDGEVSGALTLQAHRASGAGISEAALQAREASVLPTSISDIMFTSGTTGRPKGVATTHGQNIRAYTAWCQAVGLTQHDRYLIVSPFFHAFGYKAGILACVISGATILPHAVFDAGDVLERLQRESISVLPGPPTLYQSLLSHVARTGDQGHHGLPPLRLAVTGAAVVPLELVERMKRELRFETVVTGYGLTESCGIATMCRAHDDLHTIARTSGRAIDGVEVQVVDSAGNPVPSGEPGEVVIRGYNVMQGYFEAPNETREVIDADGFLHTGDIGVLDVHGNLRITDRLKDMYIAGGFNCYPAEIERTLSAHPGVAQVAVIGIPDVRLGEVGMAFIVPRAGHFLTANSTMSGTISTAGDRDPTWSEALTAYCRERMANYKVPRRFAIVQELPLNASGKVVKGRLRESIS